MNKQDVIEFFDRLAPGWDAGMVTDDGKLNAILDAAGVREGVTVLDVACGTGVLTPYYMERKAAGVLGVDISPEMVRIAKAKNFPQKVRLVCGDVETLPVQAQYDCCVVYNAFPHFEDPAWLVERLSHWVRPGGRLTVAHGMSLAALHRHHAGRAEHVSHEMLRPESLAQLLYPWFEVDVQLADDEKYIVSGVRVERR